MQQTGYSLIGLGVLLLFNAFLTASQVALTNARRHILRERAEQGSAGARLAAQVAEDSTRVLSTFQLARLLIHFVVAAVLTNLLLAPISEFVLGLLPNLGAAAAVVTFAGGIPLCGFLSFILAELIPSAIVQRNAESWAAFLASPARFVIMVFSPPAGIVNGLRRMIVTAGRSENEIAMVTEAEIMTLVDAGQEGGAIEQEEKEMIYSVFQLDETVAREIMRPRIDIVALDVETAIDDAIKLIIKAGHSRIPLYKESLDHIVGVVYAKDLLNIWHQDRPSISLRSMMRKAYFVPESKSLLNLLREMQEQKIHMAIIIDEYGGTAGLVTIEDVVEEIVGEIRDEYDMAEEAPLQTISPDEFIVNARLAIDDLNRRLEINLPDEDADTLGGFIYEQLGKVPEVGEKVDTGRIHLEVLSVVGKRIGKVRIKRVPHEQTEIGKDGNSHAGPDK